MLIQNLKQKQVWTLLIYISPCDIITVYHQTCLGTTVLLNGAPRQDLSVTGICEMCYTEKSFVQNEMAP